MTEIAAIMGPTGAAIVTILILRFTHFEKAISELDDKLKKANADLNAIIGNEIKKGEYASVETIKDLVKRSSTIETALRSMERIERRLGSFIFDFVSLGMLTVIGIIAAFATQLDPVIIVIMGFLGYIVFLDIYNFVANVQDFQEIKRKLRKGQIG